MPLVSSAKLINFFSPVCSPNNHCISASPFYSGLQDSSFITRHRSLSSEITSTRARVKLKAKGSEEFEDKDLKNVDPGSYTDRMSELFKKYIDGKIGTDELVDQIKIVTNSENVADLLKENVYDMDGNLLTNLSPEEMFFTTSALKQYVPDDDQPRVKYLDLQQKLLTDVFANGPFEDVYVIEDPKSPIDIMAFGIEGMKTDPERAYEIITERLSKKYPDLYATFTINIEERCLIGKREMFYLTPEVGLLTPFAFLVAGFFFASSNLAVDLKVMSPGSALWSGFLLSLGLSLVLFSTFAGQAIVSIIYRIPVSRHFLFCPIPFFGFGSCLWNDASYLPNRSCMIDQALASSALSWITSLALLSADTPSVPFYLRLLANDFGWHEKAGTLTNVALVTNPLLFHHSCVLSELFSQASSAIMARTDGSSLVAIGPLTLAGIMGLNFSACNLLFLSNTLGGRIVKGLAGEPIFFITNGIVQLAVIAAAIKDPSSIWPWFIIQPFAWMLEGYLVRVKNDLVPVKSWRIFLALVFVGMGIFLLLPNDIFEFVFRKSPSALVDQVLTTLR